MHPPRHFETLGAVEKAACAVDKPDFSRPELLRMKIAGLEVPKQPLPLRDGTLSHVNEWTERWHRSHAAPARDVACYFAAETIVSGEGQIWLPSGLITSPEIMPAYVFEQLVTGQGGDPSIEQALGLPLRNIEAPCVVLLGHGVQVYGHFLIEMLFRILVAQRACTKGGEDLRFLLDARSPAWLLKILGDHLGIPLTRIEFFDPNRERVFLRRAVVPGLVHRDDGFHPVANGLIASLLARNVPRFASPFGPRVFIARKTFRNAFSYQRYCLNETKLAKLAENKYGFKTVAIETLSWPEQIAVFRDARYVVGLWGSGLHNTLFSQPGTRVGVIGMMNFVQSHIGALRGHELAYLEKDIKLSDAFHVDEDAFAMFLDAVMAD